MSSERACHKEERMLCVRLIYKPQASGHDIRERGHRDLSGCPITHTHVPCHVLYSTHVWRGLWRAESHAVSPLSLSNRLWLSEAGAFLQFVPTSLLNHLHYLTVFPQRELQLSVSALCKFDESVHSGERGKKNPGKSCLSLKKKKKKKRDRYYKHEQLKGNNG